jgi:hypothetical protein
VVGSEGKSLLDRNHRVVILEVQHASAHALTPGIVLIAPSRISLIEHVFIRFKVVNGYVLALRIKEIKEFAVRETLSFEIKRVVVEVGVGVHVLEPLPILGSAPLAERIGATEGHALLVLTSDLDFVEGIDRVDDQTLLNDLADAKTADQFLHHRALSGGRFADQSNDLHRGRLVAKRVYAADPPVNSGLYKREELMYI